MRRPAALGLLVAVTGSSSATGDLHISLAANPASPVAGGAAFTVSADVSNSSGTDVNSQTANIVLPSGISFVSSGDGWRPRQRRRAADRLSARGGCERRP